MRLTESRSPVAWSKTLRVDEDDVCMRALPAGEPARRAERFTAVKRRSV